MPIVGGIDIHRQQLTFDYVDTDSGEIATGRISPADRECLRAWLGRFAGRPDVAFALEGCTGWRYVVEELVRAGIEAHVAEPAETAARRGPKRRAKTDRTDSRLLRELLTQGRIPESWIPRNRCWRPAPWYASTRICWTSGPVGCSESRPACSTWACPN